MVRRVSRKRPAASSQPSGRAKRPAAAPVQRTDPRDLAGQGSPLALHFDETRRSLELQLVGFGELALALEELREVSLRCRCCGLGVEVLEAADEAMASSASGTPPALLRGSAHEAERLAVLGDYFAVFRHRELSELHYAAAVGADQQHLVARLGLAKLRLEHAASLARTSGEELEIRAAIVLASAEAYQAAWLVARLLRDTDVTKRVEAALGCNALSCSGSELAVAIWERRACQALGLLDNAIELASGRRVPIVAEPGCSGTLELLQELAPLLRTSAASLVEGLARKWLVPPPWHTQVLDAIDAASVPLPSAVVSLLVGSQAFAHAGLERHLMRWRGSLARELVEFADEALFRFPSAVPRELIRDAAAVACHCNFVGYCIPFDNEQAGEGTVLARAQRQAGSSVAWVLTAMYECPEEPAPTALRQLALPSDALSVLVTRCEVDTVEHLVPLAPAERLGSGSQLPSDVGCREFYELTAYPPWHPGAAEAAGSIPVSIHERLYELFPWRRASSSPASGRRLRILIAGCGSGHQVAVEIRVYADCDFVALDCSPVAIACAQRKLRMSLSESDFSRVRFLVCDILVLSRDMLLMSEGFDLVICGGVLHHLSDPNEGLKRLAAMLKGGGVLQLATYSRLSVETWQETIFRHLRQDPRSRHLYQSDGRLLRAPTRQEVRTIRKGILNLPQGDEVRDLSVHFREFFTFAGILDLFFHPLETSFSLLELAAGPLRAAQLEVVGVYFPDVNCDLSARRKFCEAEAARPACERDPCMTDLSRWHALEEADPDFFGRMHWLFLEHGRADVC